MSFITNIFKENKYNANSLFTYIDSLVYEIKTDHAYEDFYEEKSLLILVTIQKTQIFLILPIKK